MIGERCLMTVFLYIFVVVFFGPIFTSFLLHIWRIFQTDVTITSRSLTSVSFICPFITSPLY